MAVALTADDEAYTGGSGYTLEGAKANAEFIVRAVNSHDELVEACKKALTCASINSDVRELIRAAISKASQ